MQVAIAGKGGSGKTTVCALVARVLARRGHRVRAIDADSNPNLGVSLGIDPDRVWDLDGLPPGLLTMETDDTGLRRPVLTKQPTQIFEEHGIDAPDQIRMIVASRIDHAGSG